MSALGFSLGSFRTGVILKYKIEFPEASLKVSNDVFAGDVTLDADISATMGRGLSGAQFEITLYDLPEKYVQQVATLVDGTTKPTVKITLGYMDTSSELVMEGTVESVEAKSNDDKLVTTFKGRESAAYALGTTFFDKQLAPGLAYTDAISAVLAGDGKSEGGHTLPPNRVSTTPKIGKPLASGTLNNAGFQSRKMLGVLNEIAERAQGEFMVLDKQVFFGNPIAYDDYAPPNFDYGTNLAKFSPFTHEIPEEDDINFPDPVPAASVTGFRFIVTGDPKLRPGQKVTPKVKNYDSMSPEFRIRNIVHRYSSSSGYFCEGVATQQPADARTARRLDAQADRSAASVARTLRSQMNDAANSNPAIEVGAIKTYAPAQHQADLYFGQRPQGDETQPSINSPIDQDDGHVYANKPIASPFAWRKCGLMVPIYPGMKSVIAHNRGVSSDGFVSGFIWSNDPNYAPPSVTTGDWWLTLPIDFDSSQPPQDSAKVVNDLTANDGRRFIDAKGLKISVGSNALGTLGSRPTLGNADECTIVHSSGAAITLKGSSITMTDGGSPGASITIANGTIKLTDGTVTLQIGNGQVSIS